MGLIETPFLTCTLKEFIINSSFAVYQARGKTCFAKLPEKFNKVEKRHRKSMWWLTRVRTTTPLLRKHLRRRYGSILFFVSSSALFSSKVRQKKQTIDSFRHFKGLSCKLQNNFITEAWKERHFLNGLNKWRVGGSELISDVTLEPIN